MVTTVNSTFEILIRLDFRRSESVALVSHIFPRCPSRKSEDDELRSKDLYSQTLARGKAKFRRHLPCC